MPLRELQEIQGMLRRLSAPQVNPGPRLSGWRPSRCRISFRSKRTQFEKTGLTRGQRSRPVTAGGGHQEGRAPSGGRRTAEPRVRKGRRKASHRRDPNQVDSQAGPRQAADRSRSAGGGALRRALLRACPPRGEPIGASQCAPRDRAGSSREDRKAELAGVYMNPSAR